MTLVAAAPADDERGRLLAAIADLIDQRIDQLRGPGICPHCGATTDIVAKHEADIAAARAFSEKYRYLCCPNCRKRVGGSDSIDAYGRGPRVRMVCQHCDHRWEQPR